MTKTRQNIGTDSQPYYEGDSLEIVVSVTEDGSAKDLSNADPEWAMSETPRDAEKLSQSASGVTASVTDAANGEITVDIDAGATDGLTGGWYHEVRVEDQNGDKTIVTRGQMTINHRVNK